MTLDTPGVGVLEVPEVVVNVAPMIVNVAPIIAIFSLARKRSTERDAQDHWRAELPALNQVPFWIPGAPQAVRHV